MVTVMVHTGSVSIGHLCGGYYRDVVRKIYPETLKHPDNGIFVLPLGERHRERGGPRSGTRCTTRPTSPSPTACSWR